MANHAKGGNGHLPKVAQCRTSSIGWPVGLGVANTPVVKKVIRLDVPVDKYPNYNFVGRILGPRGNSLKRIEAMIQCRVYTRGKGSVKDTVKDYYKKEQLRELAMINGTLREESPSKNPSMSPGMSPFNSTGMKSAKTGR